MGCGASSGPAAAVHPAENQEVWAAGSGASLVRFKNQHGAPTLLGSRPQTVEPAKPASSNAVNDDDVATTDGNESNRADDDELISERNLQQEKADECEVPVAAAPPVVRSFRHLPSVGTWLQPPRPCVAPAAAVPISEGQPATSPTQFRHLPSVGTWLSVRFVPRAEQPVKITEPEVVAECAPAAFQTRPFRRLPSVGTWMAPRAFDIIPAKVSDIVTIAEPLKVQEQVQAAQVEPAPRAPLIPVAPPTARPPSSGGPKRPVRLAGKSFNKSCVPEVSQAHSTVVPAAAPVQHKRPVMLLTHSLYGANFVGGFGVRMI